MKNNTKETKACCKKRCSGYRPTAQQIMEYSRRDFVKISSLALAGAFGMFYLPGFGSKEAWAIPPQERVVRVHCGSVQDYDYVSDDYASFLKQPVMEDMFARGICSLTNRTNVIDAWQDLLVNYQPGHKIAIKLNMNGYKYSDANQTCEMAYTIINSLILFGVAAENIKVYDIVRFFPDEWRAKWNSDVELVHQRNRVSDENATVYFPAEDRTHNFPTVISQADHLINVGLQKGHKGFITGSIKNHFGSVPDPQLIHPHVFDNMCVLANSPFIRGKTRLIVMEAPYMTWYYEYGPFTEPHATDLMPAGISGRPSPNFMLFGTNMVAVDSVMADIHNHELAARNERTWENTFISTAAAPPYNLGPREVGTIVPNPAGWSQVDLSYNTLDYVSFDLPQADRSQIDSMNALLKSGNVHREQLRHLVTRYELGL